MNKLYLFTAFILLAVLSGFSQNKQEEQSGLNWPKEIEKNGTLVVLYQPQLESLEGNILQGRMALSVTPKEEEIVFGALWFKATISADYDERTAYLEKLDITKIHFPEFEDTVKIERFTGFLTKEMESWNMVMSLDRILASLKDKVELDEISEKLNNTPPEIYFRTEPAVLITIDGDPIIKKIEGKGYNYVVNTPFFIVEKKNKYYIKGGKFWYVSNEVVSGYIETKNVPSDLVKFAKENLPDSELDSISKAMDKAPEIIVVTKPSELISTDGKPEYAPINGTQLLYVSNTSDDIIRNINTQELYVLLAGRWYKSKTLEDGSWTFVEPSGLPEDFSKIPEDSEMAEVRVSVPGTPEAQDALLEQVIPQTATVDRKTTTVEVKWDGDPKFEKIKDADVSVAKNSDKTVLLIDKKYYCVDDGIWFIAGKPDGPWVVSDVRPDEVDQIPPESEAYNVKYVYVYESTPEVVYVGYLPGYTSSYVYGGCVVYGTGYWYRPWYHHYYYPRPVTWGFGVHWNPYTGWGFSFGISYGWVGWGFHPYSRAYWGPRGFYPGYRHGYYHGYRHGYRHGAARGYAAGYRQGSRHSYNNVYRKRGTSVHPTGSKRARTNNLNNKARPSTRPNNVYTDKKGNVYQRDKTGNWQQKNNNRTRPTTQPASRPSAKPAQKPTQRPSTKPATRPSTGQTRPANNMSTQQRQQLNSSYQNRSRGNTNYNRARSHGGGGARTGGGGRRR